MKITKLDLKMLKTATSLVFRSNYDKNQIDCCFDNKGSFENKVYTIYLDNKWGYKNPSKAFTMIHCSQLCRKTQTIIEMLKENDNIYLHWRKDWYSSELVKKFDLYHDALYLIVERESKGNKKTIKRYEFEINHSVTLNNCARMIDPVG